MCICVQNFRHLCVKNCAFVCKNLGMSVQNFGHSCAFLCICTILILRRVARFATAIGAEGPFGVDETATNGAHIVPIIG